MCRETLRLPVKSLADLTPRVSMSLLDSIPGKDAVPNACQTLTRLSDNLFVSRGGWVGGWLVAGRSQRVLGSFASPLSIVESSVRMLRLLFSRLSAKADGSAFATTAAAKLNDPAARNLFVSDNYSMEACHVSGSQGPFRFPAKAQLPAASLLAPPRSSGRLKN